MKIESTEARASDRDDYVPAAYRWYCDKCGKSVATEIREGAVCCSNCHQPLVDLLPFADPK
jgi:hypothetical protein